MINEFSRSELLLGPDSMNRLKNTTIALFGIGGTKETLPGTARLEVFSSDIIRAGSGCSLE